MGVRELLFAWPISALVLAIGITSNRDAYADLIFSAPPREDPAKGDEIYGPVVKHLSEILGEHVIYEHPMGWFQYSSDMRKGKYDIVFDGPHFAAWRIKHLGHTPVAKLPGELDFFVIAHSNDNQTNSLQDLVTKKFCSLLSPNLGTVTMYAQYKNPVVQPKLYDIEGSFRSVYNAFKQGKCEAAVIRDNIYNKLDAKEKQTIKIIFKSKPLPNQTFTVSKRISQKKRDLIAYALTSFQGREFGDKLLSRFSKTAKYFVATDIKDYQSLELLLEGVVWGW